jgi:hypothetical protein
MGDNRLWIYFKSEVLWVRFFLCILYLEAKYNKLLYYWEEVNTITRYFIFQALLLAEDVSVLRQRLRLLSSQWQLIHNG